MSAPTFLLLLCCASLHAQNPDPGAVARQALDDLLAGRFDALAASFDTRMKQALPVEKLSAALGTPIKAQFGEFKKVTGPAVVQVVGPQMTAYDFPVEFEKTATGLRIVLNGEGKVAGIRFVPLTAAGQALALDVGGFRMPGYLMMPAGAGPFPLVVFVHGSGPHDADENIGPNHPFLDLARGLAARGVASFRYVKRTKLYPPKDLQNYTVRQEVMEDALGALELARSQPKVDPKRVFLLGHSLGGFLGPRIAADDPSLRGLILLAGNTRPVEVLIHEQVQFLGKGDAEEKKVLAMMPDGYRKDLAAYDPVATAKKLELRILILQGEQDYQVTMKDFAGWQTGLKGRSAVTMKSYPKLNHLFGEGEGKPGPDQYGKATPIPAYVLDDIAAWVKEK